MKKDTSYSLLYKIKRFKRDINQWSIATLAIVFIIAFPVITIFLKLFSGPGETWDHIVATLLPEYTKTSITLIIGCSVFTLIFGVSTAWIVSRYDFPGRKMLEWLLILPLAIPSYITAYAYVGVFDYGGTLELLLESVNITLPKIDIMNTYGLIFVLSFSLYPYVYVSARAVFLHQAGNLIEASKLLGAGELKTFFKVVFPLARPAIIGGLILVLMEVLNDYGAAKYYGVSTFTVGIFRSWFSLEEPDTAVYLSAILIVIIFGLIVLERFQRRKKKYHNASKSNRPLRRKNSKGVQKIGLICWVGIPVFIGFLIPVAQLLYWAVLTYTDVFSVAFFYTALQSLGIAILSAVITVIIALKLIYFTRWNKIKQINLVAKMSTLGYAIPGAVIAVGVMIPTLFIDKWLYRVLREAFSWEVGLLINGTIIGLIYAYAVRFLAVAYSPIEGSVSKVGEGISESSMMLGAGRWRTFFSIDIPLIKKGMWSAVLLVFVDIMKELPLTLILKPYGVTTLAVKAYEYASDEMIAEAALPSLCVILTGILPVIFLNRLITK